MSVERPPNLSMEDYKFLIEAKPRMKAVEDISTELRRRQDKLEDSVQTLRTDIARVSDHTGQQLEAMRASLSNDMTSRISDLDNHLTHQDETLEHRHERSAGDGKGARVIGCPRWA